MKRRITGVAAAVVATLATSGPAATAATVLQDGHIDIGARIVDGRLRAQVKDGTTSTVIWREPSEVVLHARPEARTTVPSAAAFGFLGTAGTPLWLLPQVQRQGLLWPGWNTEELTSGPLAWSLDAVEGPGRFALFTAGACGDVTKLFDSGDGLPDVVQVPAGTHAHGNWAFGAEGRYRLTFTASLPNAPAGTDSDTQTVTVTVGAVDPESGAPLAGGTTPPGGTNPPGGSEQSGGGPPSATEQPPAVGRQPSGRTRRDGRAGRVRLAASRPTVRGRSVTLRLRLGTRSRVAVTVLRGRRVLTRGVARGVRAGARKVKVRLGRRLAPGRYRLRVSAAAGGRSVVRVLPLRVTATRR